MKVLFFLSLVLTYGVVIGYVRLSLLFDWRFSVSKVML